MPIVVGVRFKDSGKIYNFDPNGQQLEIGEAVVVETVRGLELGKIAVPMQELPTSDLLAELRQVVRKPTYEDYDRIKALEQRQDEVLQVCAERIAEHRLPMRLVKAEWGFDGSRLTVYFTAQQRVDFRALVRELARYFRARIELRQVGPRDEAKLLGGIGPCGRLLCCATFLPDFARVSVKMAKDQDLPLNPSKISGVCGRLLCCLSYEQEQYLEIREELPDRGEWVLTPEGPGMVVAVNAIRETVTVDVEGNYMDFTAQQLESAQTKAATVARQRASEGQAAPIANERARPNAAPPAAPIADEQASDRPRDDSRRRSSRHQRRDAAPAESPPQRSNRRSKQRTPSSTEAAPSSGTNSARSNRRRGRKNQNQPEQRSGPTQSNQQSRATSSEAAPPARQSAPQGRRRKRTNRPPDSAAPSSEQ